MSRAGFNIERDLTRLPWNTRTAIASLGRKSQCYYEYMSEGGGKKKGNKPKKAPTTPPAYS